MQTNYTLIETNKVVFVDYFAMNGIGHIVNTDYYVDMRESLQKPNSAWFTDPHKDALASIYDFTLVNYASIHFSRD